jgi:ABC-2 type transport system ATP-binding protein
MMRTEEGSMIDLQDLKKNYGEIEALRGISASVRRGEIVGLLGPNGAGKTTAMKILVGYLLPTSGTARVAGIDVTADPLAVQQRIGYLPENAPVYGDLLVQEYLRFVADMRGLDAGTGRRRMLEAIEQCAIDEVLTRTIGHLSKGYRQRVGLAATILHDPEILVLDEPTAGLDPNQIVEIRELIHRMGQTKTVILSTHILPEVEASCSRAMILIDGKFRADGTLEELTRSREQVVSLAPDDPAEARRLFESLPGVAAVVHDTGADRFHTYRLRLSGEGDIGETVYEAVRERGWALRELRRDDKTLEQVFRELTEVGTEVAA